MFALKIVKGLGLGSLGFLGVILGIIILMGLWVVFGAAAALVPAWVAMLIAGAFGLHWGFMATWVVTTGIMMLFGV